LPGHEEFAFRQTRVENNCVEALVVQVVPNVRRFRRIDPPLVIHLARERGLKKKRVVSPIDKSDRHIVARMRAAERGFNRIGWIRRIPSPNHLRAKLARRRDQRVDRLGADVLRFVDPKNVDVVERPDLVEVALQANEKNLPAVQAMHDLLLSALELIRKIVVANDALEQFLRALTNVRLILPETGDTLAPPAHLQNDLARRADRLRPATTTAQTQMMLV
jgi:hypothetical protein